MQSERRKLIWIFRLRLNSLSGIDTHMVMRTVHGKGSFSFTVSIAVWKSIRRKIFYLSQKMNPNFLCPIEFFSRVDFHMVMVTVQETKILLLRCKLYHTELNRGQNIWPELCVSDRLSYGRAYKERHKRFFTASLPIWSPIRSKNFNRRQKFHSKRKRLIWNFSFGLIFLYRINFHLVMHTVHRTKTLRVQCKLYCMQVNTEQKIQSETKYWS